MQSSLVEIFFRAGEGFFCRRRFRKWNLLRAFKFAGIGLLGTKGQDEKS